MSSGDPAPASGPTQSHLPRRVQPSSTPRTLQQPLDFHTDSVNQTHIASPNPGSNLAQHATRNTLGEAFRTMESQSTHNNTSNQPGAEQHPLWAASRLPLPGYASVGYKKLRTPTPPSPYSLLGSSPHRTPVLAESTPPKEIAEAYDRIQAERYLLHGSSDEESSQYSGSGTAPPIRTSLPPSPSPLAALRQFSSRMEQELTAKVEQSKIKENFEHSEIKENVEHSEIKENVSDDEDHTTSSLDSDASKYSRDLQRVKSATGTDSKAFSKARMGEKAGLTVENLNRQNDSKESLTSTKSAGTFSQHDSDPGVNVPKAWGSKAKAGDDWLSRINDRKEKRATSTVSDRRSLIEGIKSSTKDRREAKNFKDSHASKIPLPSSDLKSSGRTRSSSSVPTFATQTKPPMDQRPDLNLDDEFTGRSLQVSDSPPIRIKDFAQTSTSGLEIAKLTEQAVTTNRLGQLRERESQDQLSKTVPSRASPELKRESGLKRQPSASKEEDTVKPKQESDQKDTKVGTAEADLTKSDNLKGVEEQNKSKIPTSTSVPPHMLKAHMLLQRLANASHDTPSPGKAEDAKPHATFSDTPAKQTSQIPAPSKDMETPIVTGAWTDQTAADITDTAEPQTVQKTPFVTGGWIDTPLPATEAEKSQTHTQDVGKDGDSSEHPATVPGTTLAQPSDTQPLERLSEEAQESLEDSGPPLPTSALQNILHKVKSEASLPEADDATLHLGESTIASLEDLVADPSPAAANISSTPPPASTPAETAAAEPIAKPQEAAAILERLDTVAPSIRDSKTQLGQLQRSLSTPAPATTTASTLGTGAGADQCNGAGPVHDFLLPCPTCPATPEWLAPHIAITPLTLPIPMLWRWRRDNGRFELTTLGMMLLMLLVLLVSEMWARARYAHPLFATEMVGFGVDVTTPDPPFALAQLAWDKTGWGWMPWFVRPSWRAMKAVGRWWSGTGGGGALKPDPRMVGRGVRGGGGGDWRINGARVKGPPTGWEGVLGMGGDAMM